MSMMHKEHSWINFKIDKRLHTKFSMILKFTGKSIREVMTQLVSGYVRDHSSAIMEIIAEHPEDQEREGRQKLPDDETQKPVA